MEGGAFKGSTVTLASYVFFPGPPVLLPSFLRSVSRTVFYCETASHIAQTDLELIL